MLSTKNIPTGSGMSKSILPGAKVVKINSITLDTVPYDQKAYHLTLHCETEPIDGLDGFFIDKDDPSKGKYLGQIGRVKCSMYPFSDGVTKSGIKIGSNLLEMLMKKFGLTIVDGFSNNLCKDMSKFNKPLTKMYRKYWRRGTSSPESELAMIVFGALAVTVMANKGLTGSPPKPAPAPAPLGGAFGKESAMPSAMPSTMPSMNSMPTMKAAPPPIPEWAKAAMASPLPTHFAKDSFTELGPERAPVMPVSALRSIEPVRTEKPVQERPMERPIEKLERPFERPPIEKLERPIEKVERPLERPEKPDRPDRSERYEDDPVMSSSAPISSSVTSSSVVIDNTRKLTLSSPRSSRRKREMQSELNLDA